MKKELLVSAVAIGVTTVAMAVMIERKYGSKMKTTEEVLRNLKAETEEEKSDIIGFFSNKDVMQIKNNGYTYGMTVFKEDGHFGNESVVMEVLKGKKKVFRKEYTAEEWRTEVRDKAMQMIM